jgi:hypothetical protein
VAHPVLCSPTGVLGSHLSRTELVAAESLATLPSGGVWVGMAAKHPGSKGTSMLSGPWHPSLAANGSSGDLVTSRLGCGMRACRRRPA